MLCQVSGRSIGFSSEVKAKHRIRGPFLFKGGDCQSFEELFLPAEISIQRGDQQALAEAPGAAQEKVLACRG